jgi:subtilase family serine protease
MVGATKRHLSRLGAVALAASTIALVAASIAPAAQGAAPSLVPPPATPVAELGTAVARPYDEVLSHTRTAAPPTTADCEAQIGIACYSPTQYERAYDMQPLYQKGLTGKGRTIVIVDSFGSPTVAADLAQFDRDFGLPAPPSLRIIQPAGVVPPYDPTNSDMVGWAEETSLDVQYSHAIAPGANILLVETPVSETEGTVGFPQIVTAENYVINNNLGDVITQSFGATEETFPSTQSLLNLRSAFTNAQSHDVTVLGASGDGGATDSETNLVDFYPFRVDSWPSSDPLVTSVGGTQLHLNAVGDRTAPDNVWNDTALLGSPAAGGGGLSTVFSRPLFQIGVANVVGAHRGTPDISMSAAVDGGALVYMSFDDGSGDPPGYGIIGGTSEASPLFSGIVAIADQAAGHRLGLINNDLYLLGHFKAPGIPDITAGNNSVSFQQDGQDISVTGFNAVPGYDLASGLGTVDGAKLVSELSLFP